MASITAQSATLRARGPGVSRVGELGMIPDRDHRPVVGRKPTMPQCAAGMRFDPPVSVPSPHGAIRAAMAAAVPPLDPPATRSRS